MKPKILTAVALLLFSTVGLAQHPRLFLDASRITELQTAIGVPGSHHKEVYDAIKARVDQNDWLVYDENTSDGNWNYARSWLAREAALMYLLTNNTTYAQYAYDALYDVHNDIDPDGRIPESGYGLRRAAIGVGFAIAYDWCYNAWTTAQRDYIYDKIDQTLDNWPSYNHANLNTSHRGSNWVGVCRGGELITMLAVYEETNRASRYADLKTWLNTHMSTAYGDEGWMQEGNGYMGYTSGFLFPAILAARHIGDTDFDTEFGQHTWWKLPAYYGSFTDEQYVLQWGVGGNFLDPEGGTSALLGLIPSADLPYYQYFYDRFRGQQNPAAAGDKFDHKRGGSIWSLIYYDENSTVTDINGYLPTGIEDADKGAMYFRNRWQDQDDILVSIMGDNHYHGNAWDQKEATQIQLFAYDTRFFGGPDKDRDTQFFSTFQVDGADGYDDHNGERGLTGGVDAFEINGDYGYSIVDGGTKYAEIGMTSVKRHLMVDFSEEAAPALLSTLDIAEDGSNHDYEWHINLGESSDAVGLPTTTGTESGVPYFVVSGNNSSYVKGWVLSPASAYISEDDLRLRVRVDNVSNTNIWIVMTVGTGTPPTGVVAGSGMSSTLTVNTVNVTYNATDNRILASGAGGNFLPSVDIDNPSDGAVFPNGSDITIEATASDSDGSIAKVEFFEGTNKLGEDTSSPFSYTWSSVATGSYDLTAKAIDDLGGEATSSVVNVTVNAAGVNVAPSVSITSPADAANFTAGDHVTIVANATDTDGTISKVEFYEGGNKLGEDATSPYSFTWNSVSAGSYTLTAVATDDDSDMTTSAAVNVTVNVAGEYQAEDFSAESGTTTRDNNAGYTGTGYQDYGGNGTYVEWDFVNEGAGSATLTFYYANGSGGNRQCEILVNGSDIGDLAFGDTGGWTSYGSTNIATTLNSGNNTIRVTANTGNGGPNLDKMEVVVVPVNDPPSVSITSPADNTAFNTGDDVTITATASDTDGTISKVEFYEGSNKLGEDTSSPYSYTWSSVSAGSYLLTAVATDDDGDATTSVVVGINVSDPNTPPTVSVTAPVDNATFTAGDDVPITATASDSDGTLSKVEFYEGSNKLGEDTSSPYSFTWTSVPAGSYALTAVATDDDAAMTTSSVINIVVNPGNSPPSVSITAPVDNATFADGDDITITATASDSDGSIAKVEFFEGSNKLGEDTSSPYSYTWTNVTGGTYTLTAVAIDNGGASTTSGAINLSEDISFDTDYCKRKLITIDNSRVSGSSNLMDFPLYFSTTDNDLRTVANGGFVESAQGWDIVFTADDGVTELDHEIDSYDGSTGTYKGWVRVPSLSYNTDTEIYMYFGNSAATDPDANDELVWDSNYQGVYHLNNDYLDATSNDRDGTNSGTDNFGSTPLTAGRDFQDQADKVTTGLTTTLSSTVTISAWIRWENIDHGHSFPLIFEKSNEAKLIAYRAGGGNERRLRFESTSWSGGSPGYSNTQLNPGDWYYISVVYDQSTLDDLTFYVNGVNDGVNNGLGASTLQAFGSSDGLVIGNRTNSQRGFGGQIEEFRISNIKRNADWIATEYANQNDPGSFYTINAIEGVVEAGTATAADDNLINNTSTTISLSGNGSSTIQWQSSSDNITFTDLGGETSATLNTGNLTSTTYYRAEVGAGCRNYSNVVTVNVQVAFDGAFCKRKKITIDADQVMGSSNLTDFPFYFEITDPDLRTVVNGGFVASSAGWDITFSEDDGTTTLDHEIEFYDETTGTYKGWVRIPTLSYNQDTEIYLYFGNGSATDPDADDESVWSSGYQLAYHFIDNYEDATANNRDATAVGTNLNAAQFNKGVFYNSAADVVNSSYTGSLTQFTVSGWYKLESLSTNFPGLFQKLNAVKALVNNNGTSGPIGAIRFQPEGFSGSNDWWFSTQLQEGNTYYLTFTYDGSSHTNDPILYINGVSDAIDEGETARPSGGSIASNTNIWQMGNINASPNRGWGGTIDEFRVYEGIRSAEWIATEYNNQNDLSVFYSVTEVEYVSDPGAATALSNSLDNGTGTTLTLSGHDVPTIQWQSSTDNFNFSDIGGATVATYDTPNLTQTTYYRAKTTSGSCEFFSNTQKVVVRESFLREFSRRKRLTIDRSVVAGGENLSDFPYLLHITDDDLRTQGNGGGVFDSNGADIVFTTADGSTIIPSEQVDYNGTTGEIMVWIAVPTLYAAVDTDLFIYFGSCTFSSPPTASDTWDTHYAGVWHLNNSLEDATANGFDGANSGSTNNGTGQILQGRSFDGSSQHLTVTSTALQTPDNLTISAWIQADDLSRRQMLLWQGEVGGNGWGDNSSPYDQEMHLSISDLDDRYDGNLEPTNRIGFFLGDRDQSADPDVLQFSVPYTDTGGKHHVAVRVTELSTSPRAVMYLDGEYVGEDEGDPLLMGRGSWTNTFLMGKDGASSHYYDGMLDEVRVSTIARSEGWIATSYNNQSNPTGNVLLEGQSMELQWTGAALSSAWSTGNNWGDCRTPITGADIRISDTGGNPYPQLTGSTTVGHLTLDAGTSIDLNGQQLTITGSIENDGTLTIGANSEVVFAGSGDQQVYGSTDIASWEDLTLNNSSGKVTLSGNTVINGDLTLTSGHLDCTNGDLTLQGNLTGGSSTGYVIIPQGRTFTINGIGPGDKSGTILFPIGSSASSYSPASILNSGTDDDFTIGLLDDSYQYGTHGSVMSDKELAKTWLIDEGTPGNSDVTLTLYWHVDGEGGSFDRTSSYIAHYHDAGYWEKHGAATAATAMGGDYYAVSASGLSDFSPHTVGSGDSPLPVEILSFHATRSGQAVRLSWSTVTELNNDFFSVQRGVDGQAFQTLASVDGHGQSDVQRDYEYLDESPLPGNSYYRLKQTDFDGTFTYSEVVLVKDGVARTPELSIFPNANNGLDFNWLLQGLLPNSQLEIALYDLNGNLLVHQVLQVDVDGGFAGKGFQGLCLESGMYVLRAQNDGKEMTKRLIVK